MLLTSRIALPGFLLGLVLVATLFSACAAGTRQRGVAADEVIVEVVNDLVPGRAITVRLHSSLRGRALLGSVSPMQTARLRYRSPSLSGQFRLEAEGAGGDMFSDYFSLAPGEQVVWSLRNNTVRLVDSSD